MSCNNRIGEMIKLRRNMLHMTLEDVGNAVGVNKSTVKKWEDGFIENMRRDKIAALADILKISPVDLIRGEISGGADRSTMEEHLLDSFHQLNSDGQELAIDYVDALAEKPKYQRTDEE